MRYTLFILLLFHFCIKAQVAGEQVFTLKPAIGINGCQVNGDNYSGYNKVGAFAGIAINTRLKEKMSLELGFYFSQKGSRHNQNPDKGDFTYYRVNLNYIDMPLLFRCQLNAKYFISGGPSIAYLISYTEENERGDLTGLHKFNKFETGVNFGLGRKIKDKFFIEARISNSFMPIRNYGLFQGQVYYPNAATRFFRPGLYNNVLTFLISYKLDLKKKNAAQ